VIFNGYGHYYGSLHKDLSLLEKYGVKVIFQMGDAQVVKQQLEKEPNRLELWKKSIGVVVHMPPSWVGFKDFFKMLPNLKVIQIPWPIDTKKYKDYRRKRDIDVSMICSIGDTWKYHDLRRAFRDTIMGMNIKKVVGQHYGNEYIDYLNRSKIFVVESSARGALTQKYVEGIACGCLLIGTLPYQVEPFLLEDGVSFVRAETPAELEQKIKYYLQHPSERKKIIREAKRRIKAHRLQRVVKQFEKEVLRWEEKCPRRTTENK